MRPGSSRRSWSRTSSDTAGSRERTRIAFSRDFRALRSDLIDPTIAVHHGRVVKRTGDGSLIEFRSVVDAVRCAIEVQNGLIERNAGVPPERRIEFRVGIHLGDVVEESDGDLMGDGVNIAARLEGHRQARRDLPFRGRLSSGERAARSRGHRSRPDPTQEHRRAGPRLFARGRQACAPSPRQQDPSRKEALLAGPLAAGIAALLIVLAGGAWWLLGRTGLRRRNEVAGAGRFERDDACSSQASLHRRAAVRQSLRRPEPGLFRRWRHREPHHRPLAPQRRLRDRAQHRLHIQGQDRRRSKEIGKELGVRYVLEGSVQRDQDRMRVNVQLIDAETGNHLWADRFDKPLPISSRCRTRSSRASPTIGHGTHRRRGATRAAGAEPRLDGSLFSGYGCFNKG